jgi:hypothetical protein
MIVFLGTPHAGFSKTSWKETVAVIQTALVSEDFSSYQKAKSTVKSLEDDSMLTVSRAFHDMEQDADVEILSCYETFRTSTKRGRIMVSSSASISRYSINNTLWQVVGRDVATIGIPNERVHHLNANHANMCKFNSRNDSGYLYITNCIRRLLALDHESVASIEHLRIIKRQNSDDESQNPGFGESDGNVDLFGRHQPQ